MRDLLTRVWRYEQLPIALLASVVTLVSLLDWSVDFSAWMMTPALVEWAWELVQGGEVTQFTMRVLSTVVTYAFLHANAEHLLGNMLFFWIFGSVILEICGWRWMLAIFFLTTIGAAMGHLFLERGGVIPMLGASGAVMGFEGAYLGLVVRKSRSNPHVWPMARPISPGELAAVGVVGVMLDVMGVLEQSPWSATAYGAHIGGFVTGIAVSFLRRD